MKAEFRLRNVGVALVPRLFALCLFAFSLSTFHFASAGTPEAVVVDSVTRAAKNTGKVNFATNQLQANGVYLTPGGAFSLRQAIPLAQAAVDSRITGVTPGTAAQNLYSTLDNSGSGTYVRSTTHVLADTDLTGIAVYCSATPFTVVAISSNIVVYANHVSIPDGATVRFKASDGTVISRTITASPASYRVPATDIKMGKLSSALPATVTPIPFPTLEDARSLIGAPVYYLDQNQKLFVAEVDSFSGSDLEVNIARSADATRLTFWKSGGLISGDSSHPVFAVVDNVPVLLGMLYQAPTTTTATAGNLGRWRTEIVAAISSQLSGTATGDSPLRPSNKAAVGLGNVDNTADAVKSVSSAGIAYELNDSDNLALAILYKDASGWYIGEDPSGGTSNNVTFAGSTAAKWRAGMSAQAHSAELDTIAGLSLQAYGESLLEMASASALRTYAGLAIGTNVQAYDAALTALAAGSDFVQFTGPTTSTKVFTLPNASVTLLYTGGPGGTPSSLTLTNATALPLTSGVTGVLPVANGGTGTTSLTDLGLPSQTGNSGKYLTTNGSASSWATVTGGLASTDIDTSAELAAILTDETGSGGGFVRATSPTLVTPTLGAATASSLYVTNGSTVSFAAATSPAYVTGVYFRLAATENYFAFYDTLANVIAFGTTGRGSYIDNTRMVTNGVLGFSASGSDPYSYDTSMRRSGAAKVMKFSASDASGGTWCAAPTAPAQITSDQNNYNPGGTSYYLRLNSDASRNLTGLTFTAAQVDGQAHIIVNVGAQNIVIVNESASSTAANRFHNSTGADITIAADQEVNCWYDATTARWRVTKRGF